MIDLSKTPKDQAAAVNAVIAYMHVHFAGVGAQDLRAQVVGKELIVFFPLEFANLVLGSPRKGQRSRDAVLEQR